MSEPSLSERTFRTR